MEVVAANPGASVVPPFRDHDVREWSRIDSITGALERARLETDHWSANTLNSSHKYGKVVDSVTRSTDNGLRQSASRQLEVFHSRGPQGRVQVVRTRQTATTRWSSGTTNTTTETVGKRSSSNNGGDFENLRLPLNTLDLTSQKSKASVGRSVARRPPTRQRLKESIPDITDTLHQAHLTAATNLHRVSRLCHQIHETAVRQAFGSRTSIRPVILQQQQQPIVTEPESSVEICEIESVTSENNTTNHSHNNLARTKSTSSDDINTNNDINYTTNKSIEDLDDLEQLQSWRRTSKIRRSLQFPKQNRPTPTKPLDLPENSVSVKKIREDLEKGRRLNTALRNNSVDLEALDQILQSISSASSDRASDDIENETPKKQKRNSFVTVESIKQVKDRLRRTSSPTNDIYNLNGRDDDTDDGIETEEINTNDKDITIMESSRVKSYVYGMESLLNKKPGIGTGSLESRVRLVNGNSSLKNEDWYNRRKSYGFEEVHNHENSSKSISINNRNLVESSTDSGICKSSEIETGPSKIRNSLFNEDKDNESNNSDHKVEEFTNSPVNGINFGQVKKLATTYQQEEKKSFTESPVNDLWTKKLYKNSDSSRFKPEFESTTITIPIVKNNNIIDLTWNDDPEKETKRHSIAVDESKYVTNNINETKYRRTSLASNDHFFKTDDEDSSSNRKTKKVEFCKTEVHFAAESGKVNIVATDEKPPPTQNFRRRRRNSGPIPENFNKNGLPVLHFGDSSYEKSMFGISDEVNPAIYENLKPRTPVNLGMVTVNTNNSINNEVTDIEEEKKELADEIKGILKNKPIKPKPYHLGENVALSDNSSDEENKWGVKLRHVEKKDTPIWKSTVTVRNYFEKQSQDKDQPEFQKLLKNLRPTGKVDYTSDNDSRYLNPKIDNNKRSSWSTMDKTKKSMDDATLEHKGYLTKINFGEGEATVVENDSYDRVRHPTWPRSESLSKDTKQLLNKGLVVRIGREDSASNHTMCSKMTTTQDINNATTTTKITIDLTPSPPIRPNDNRFIFAKYQRSQEHSFKSTSLILNTINQNNNKTAERQDQNPLEALKKLYENVNSDSDSDADKEVQLLMSKITPAAKQEHDDASSEVSGSWSKMRAFKNFNGSRVKEAKNRYDLNQCAKKEKDSLDRLNNTSDLNIHIENDKNTKQQNDSTHVSTSTPHSLSPVTTTPNQHPDLKTTQRLSSPSLVGRNQVTESVIKTKSSSSNELFKNTVDKNLQSKISNEKVVLRTPKKSEMTYFGVNLSPKPIKKISQAVIRKENKLSDKPDLLQHYKKSPSPTRISKQRQKTPERTNGPIYENIQNKYGREFDSSIVEELTKAADQIMQAVNGYTDEDSHCRASTEDEDTRKKRTDQLDTIVESKSWKKEMQAGKNKPPNTKSKLKHTSSTSSIESLSRRRPVAEQKVKPSPRKKQEKPEANSLKANTRARRLQRASSREALLQSHGSSSEDLPSTIEVPLRKPRLVKKTKAVQLTVTNGVEMKKPTSTTTVSRRKEDSAKGEERILGSLPEIRHKTAVSTIRSTTDKSTRDNKTKQRSEELRKKPVHKRETPRGTNPSISSREKNNKLSSSTANKETVMHRISTANIKKCSRSEGAVRH